jgi:uncharacterized protein (DUF885 family)/Tol biopolymer transport system component
VAGLAFLEDGDLLASAGCIFSLKLWDVESGQQVGSPVVPGCRAYTLAFSPDGDRVAVGDADKRIQIWDVKTGQQQASLRGHGTYIMGLTFSPDGKLLASAGDDNSIKVWDLDTSQVVHDLLGHITPVTALAFSPDGGLLASGAVQFSTTILLWDLASGEIRRTLVDHSGNINDLEFSPDGALLASASADRTVRIWRVKSGQVLHTLAGQRDPVYALAFSPGGDLLATSGDEGAIRLWDVETGRDMETLGGHGGSVFHLAFSPDGSRLASGGVDGTVLLRTLGEARDTEPLALQRSVPQAAAPLPTISTGLSDGPAEGTIAFASYREGESKIFLMQADGSDVTRVSRTGLRESRPAWSPDGSRIAYVRRMNNANHEIYVMNADGSGATRLTNRPDSVESEPTWSPDGRRIAFISNERPTANTLIGRFHVWVMNADGSDQELLTDIGGSNTSPDWSPDGTRLVFDSTRDGNHEIYVMDPSGGHLVNLTQHPAKDYSPTWSPDGTRIAFVSDRHGDEEIYVMGADGSNPTRLTDNPGFDKAPAWSPDGQHIVFYSRRLPLNTEVYIMRANGSEQVRLTYDTNFDGFPVWKPSAALAEVQVAPWLSEAGTGTGRDRQVSLASVSGLEGLPLDRFFAKSFELLMLRDPEWVSSEGLAGHFGTGHGQLTDLSDAYRRETQQMEAAILDMLRTYDREQLSREQQISYDVYEWYLADRVRGQEFMYHDFPVTHFITGVQNQLIQLFTDLHPIASHQDAEEYVARLGQVDVKFEGLVEGLQLRANTGVILPSYIFPWLMRDISRIAHGEARYTPFYTSFEEKLDALGGLSADERQALLQDAERAIEDSVIPGFADLEEALQALRTEAPAHTGAWQYSNGRAYYDHILRHHSTTDMTPEEIHELGLKELARVQTEMRTVFDELGYPQDESLPELYARVAREAGSVQGGQVAEAYEAIIDEAESKLDAAFDIRPQAEVVVIAGDQGDYYVSASLDGSRPGAFFARVGGSKARFSMPTLAYHEAVPGHHFQIAIAQESDLPLFRNVLGFTGYAEGWALYAEQLAYELGWYNDDPYGNLGRLRDQAFRAARLVVDTGLHTQGWTFDQAHEFMVENAGLDPGFMEFEVTRYITWPGQATAYMVGMLKIMELRQRAQDRLGDQFDLKDFHRVVLSNGSMPLEVLERVVDAYIEDRDGASQFDDLEGQGSD